MKFNLSLLAIAISVVLPGCGGGDNNTSTTPLPDKSSTVATDSGLAKTAPNTTDSLPAINAPDTTNSGPVKNTSSTTDSGPAKNTPSTTDSSSANNTPSTTDSSSANNAPSTTDANPANNTPSTTDSIPAKKAPDAIASSTATIPHQPSYPASQQPNPYQFISDVEGWTGIKADKATPDQHKKDGFEATSEPADYYGKVFRNFKQFDQALAGFDYDAFAPLILGRSIKELQQAMQEGQLTSVDLTKFYLVRIGKYDINKLNSVLELNPDALTLARYADQVRADGKASSDMLGIPVLIKDNIETNDKMHTTGGMSALLDWNPAHDAHIVKRLRDAGAVILGKTNLSENANYFTELDPNGFSNVGGQTRNPYGFYSVLGSSSGSGAASAAEFATVTVGTETQGSINAPSEMGSIVGFKPSIGLVSRSHIIPLAASQDSAGPMARTVEDAAVELNVLADPDSDDPLYSEVKDKTPVNYVEYLKPSVYQGIKVGLFAKGKSSAAWLTDIRATLDNAGVSYEVVYAAPNNTNAPKLNLECEFNFEFADMAKAENMPVKSVAELMAFNNKYPQRRAVWGQTDIVNSAHSTQSRTHCLGDAESKRKGWEQTVDSYFSHHDFQVLVSQQSLANVYALAGAPSASVPFGYETKDGSIMSMWHFYKQSVPGTPVSTHVMGRRFDDGNVLAIAQAIETGRESIARRQHKKPDLEATIKMNQDAGIFAVHKSQRAASSTYIANN
ncbi:amidase family protein [Vibrio rarus]|uniref:amidase family protein n=1 Tax=Vibrio rarus TaxID=413403 RepID=UPI0021C3874F|nr:amidase family protein [Vibrio rarus]